MILLLRRFFFPFINYIGCLYSIIHIIKRSVGTACFVVTIHTRCCSIHIRDECYTTLCYAVLYEKTLSFISYL